MTNRTYRVTEIVGTSPDGIDQAIRNGIERASQTLRHIDWFEVTQVRGQAKDGGVEHFQVGLKIGFRLEDDGPVEPTRFGYPSVAPSVVGSAIPRRDERGTVVQIGAGDRRQPGHRPRDRGGVRRGG